MGCGDWDGNERVDARKDGVDFFRYILRIADT
jgi:hypothetical protein